MMKQNQPLIYCILLACTYSSTALSAEWSLTPSLSPTIKYDDNVFMRDQNKQGSSVVLLKPGLTGKYQLENMSASVDLGYSIERYAQLSEINANNPFIKLNSDYKTERSEWGLGASYIEDSSRNTALEDTGDFTTQATLTTRTISPSYSYQLTERDSISLNASYSDRRYSTADFNDNETKTVSTGWQHRFSERLALGLSLTARNYQSVGTTVSNDDDDYSLSGTFDYQYDPLWSIGGHLGVRYLDSAQRFNNGLTQTNNSSGESADIRLSRKGEIDSFSLSLSRAISPSSTGDVNEQDRVSIAYSRELSERLSAGVNASYQQTSSALNNGSDKRENINFSPSINWKLQQNLALNFAYNYRQQKQSVLGRDAKSNAILMTVNYDWDGIRFSR